MPGNCHAEKYYDQRKKMCDVVFNSYKALFWWCKLACLWVISDLSMCARTNEVYL